jgi:hypothetical protein
VLPQETLHDAQLKLVFCEREERTQRDHAFLAGTILVGSPLQLANLLRLLGPIELREQAVLGAPQSQHQDEDNATMMITIIMATYPFKRSSSMSVRAARQGSDARVVVVV